MNITKHPAGRGLLWLGEGVRILMSQPLALFAVTFLSLAIMLLPSIIPGIGTILSMALQPAIYVGLMTAVQAAENKQTPNPRNLLIAFSSESGGSWQPLLVLGAINATLSILVFGLVSLFFPAESIVSAPAIPGDKASVELGELVWSMIVFGVMYTPVQMALWYSPLLIAWHQIPVGKSLFFSIVAVWRNKWAFALLFLGWFAVLFVIVLVLQLLVLGLGLAPTLLSMLIAPLSLLIVAAAYCSFWVSYRDVIR
ncbi:MAG: BPSS1780 family membrane protein [Burkholderiaceae bacterium]